ncbi:FxDxF family PEP-CTERM protein [Comamonadaceae bacterium G21597-S1]|nr:FxDxF family PEP-CTERM protein [Comamonadaceae bacterium G21597-S1]
MKSITFTKRAVALAVLAGAGFGAHAADYALGVISASGAPTSFNAFHAGAGLTTFDDNFTFTLATAGLTGGSVIDFSIPGITGASFTGATLYAGTPGAATATYAVASGTASSMAFSSVLTPAGSYFFNVTGFVTPGVSLGAAYSGALSVAAAPIPEPESYAMLLAGLGVMGAIAVRRNKAKKQD